MLVSEFDYEFPPELVAQEPAAERAASRLLRLHARSGALEDLRFADLPSLLGARDAVVLNDTRVVKARLAGRKRSGGKGARPSPASPCTWAPAPFNRCVSRMWKNTACTRSAIQSRKRRAPRSRARPCSRSAPLPCARSRR